MVQLPESFSGLRFDKVSVISFVCKQLPSFLMCPFCALRQINTHRHTDTHSLFLLISIQAARDLYMHFNGRVSLLGVEERELRIKACNAYPRAPKHYVKRVLINPGSKYRIKVIPSVLEVRL